MIRLFCTAWALISMATCALAQLPPPSSLPSRLAVISTNDSTNLAALVVTEISGNPAIQLVERDDLAKIGDELKLQQMAGSDAVALGKLIGADGLLFLDKNPDGIHVRFTAVALGYALFDYQVAAGSDLPQIAKSISHRVVDYGPKLKLDPAKTTPISILNLRADYPNADSTVLERKLTLLLESRLASLPDYVVLERRHAWSLSLEKLLSPTSNPLLKGAYVVDGTLSLPGQGPGEMTVHLRLRSPVQHQTLLDIHGSSSNLLALVEQMTIQIRQVTGSNANTSPWQSESEAREYLLEGIWAWRNNSTDLALEALDSAELLGEKAPDLLAVRILVLCSLAAESNQFIFGNDSLPDDPSPDRRIDALMRAITDQVRYQGPDMESKLQILDHFHSGDGRADYSRQLVIRAASKILVMLDHTNTPKAEKIRSAIRQLTGYDPINGQLPGDWETAVDYADDWSASKEEEMTYYRKLCTTYPSAAYNGWRLQWQLSPNTFCQRFISTPEARRAALIAFFQSLLQDPVGKPTGLLDLAEWADPAEKDAACRKLYDDLWAERDDLVKTKRICPFLAQAFELEKARRVTVADPQVIGLLHMELQKMDYFYDSVNRTWCPELFPASEAPSLWKDLQDYEKRYEAAHGSNGYFPGMNQRFMDRFGNPDAAGPTQEPLLVNRFWYPKDTTKRLMLSVGAFAQTSDGLWVMGELDGPQPVGALYHVKLDSLETETVTRAETASPRDMLITKDAVYLICLTSNEPPKTMVECYDLALHTWGEHEVPGCTSYPGSDTIYEISGQLYLGLKRPDGESAIARYDAKTGEIKIVASSRRRPAQNQFDDCPSYLVCSIFPGPSGKPCASIDLENVTTESYYISEQPGPWLPLTQFGYLGRSQTFLGRTLLYGNGSSKNNADIVILIDPAKTEPELLLGNPAPSPPIGFPGSEKSPPRELPTWTRKSVWQPIDPNMPNANDYGLRGDDLFVLVNHPEPPKTTELLWYRRGQATPAHIPLKFEMPPEIDQALTSFLPGPIPKRIRESGTTNSLVGMTVTPQGICLTPGEQGFWYVPFSDIDAYVKNNHAVESVPSPAAAPKPPLPQAKTICPKVKLPIPQIPSAFGERAFRSSTICIPSAII